MADIFLKIVNMSISACWIVLAIIRVEKSTKMDKLSSLGNCRLTPCYAFFI